MMQLASCTDSKAFNNALAKMEQSLTIRQSIEVAPLIAKQGDKREVIKEIIRVIEFFLTITGKELEQFQIIVLAGDLYEKFRTDTLEDVVLMFKMARMGDFGKVFKFDTFTVMDWANTYLDRKSEERERLIMMRKERQVKSEKKEAGGKYFHELPQELQEKFNAIGKPTPQAFLTPKITAELTQEKHKREIQRLIDTEQEEI